MYTVVQCIFFFKFGIWAMLLTHILLDHIVSMELRNAELCCFLLDI